ncbi:hypothetical protein [Hymenobacter sp. B81]|uniref:hypothetical protein n=1 Tax=Hymenobacter sp. B81 TaxID=3344878 RepID=UPI0037DD5F74
MPNTLTITATKANTTKDIEYQHPNTGVWQDSNVLTGVTKGTYTSIKCRLKGTAIESTWTTPVTVVNNVLTAPTGLAATPLSSASVGTSWNAATNAAGYVVERATNAGFTTGLTQVYAGTALSYTDTGLTASTGYYYRVKAAGTGFFDDSPVSAGVLATTSAAAPTKQYQLIVVGDSLEGRGYGTGDANDQGSFYPDTVSSKRWTAQAQDLLEAQYPGQYEEIPNYGTSGTTVNAFKTQLFTQGNTPYLPSLFNAAQYPGRRILILSGGRNDLQNGSTAQQVYDLKKNIIQQMRTVAPGVLIAIPTHTLSLKDGQASDVPSKIVQLNNLYKNNQVDLDYDLLIPWDQVPALQYVEDTTVYVDKLHITGKGDKIKAEFAAPLLHALATSGRQTYVRPPASTEYDVVWTTPSDVQISGNRLTKIAGGTAYTPGGKAISTQAIGPLLTGATGTAWRGSLVWTVKELGHSAIVGLASTYSVTGFTNIKYSWHKEAGQASAYGTSNSPANTDAYFNVAVDDELAIEVYEHQVLWKHNGVTVDSVTLADTTDLFVDVSIRDVGDYVENVALSGANLIFKNALSIVPPSTLPAEVIAWDADPTKYTVAADSVTSLVAGTSSDAFKARSTKKVAADAGATERGFFEWTINDTGSDLFIGFQSVLVGNTLNALSSLDYGFIYRTASKTMAYWISAGNVQGTAIAASTGDKFRITIWNDCVRWTKNGALVHKLDIVEGNALWVELHMTTANKTATGFKIAGTSLVAR